MPRRHPDSLIFDTIRLEGSLFVPALLEKAARGDHSGQTAADYQLPKGLSLTDEQGRAFRIAGALWKNFQKVLAREDVDAWKATVGSVSELLRDALDYSDWAPCPAPVEIHGRESLLAGGSAHCLLGAVRRISEKLTDLRAVEGAV